MIEKDRLIVTRTTRYGEADLVIQGVGPKGAKLSVFAKGALKSKKRFAGGVLEPTHYLQIVYKTAAAQSSGGMPILQEATVLESFDDIRKDYDRLELAFYFLQLISKIAQEGVNDQPEVFDILGNSLRTLQTTSNLPLLRVQVEMKVLGIQGVLPPLEKSSELLKLSIRDHEQAELDSMELRALQSHCRTLLEEYLGFHGRH